MLLYALTILVSAFLLFQVEPVIAKIILPWFGGSAAVWTSCLLFFQMVLLLGYLYAHALTRYLKPRAQTYFHVTLLLASGLLLRIYPTDSWKPLGNEDPLFRILGLLTVTVGLPYFLLSTTGPLVQAWYARRFEGAMPYRLYALSNLGSMFALLSYPVLFEPQLTTHQQSSWWSVGYIGFALLCGITALTSGNAAKDDPVAADDSTATPPTRTHYALWILLPACASVLLLAVTNHLSQNVAAIPFLWVLPLSVYLLTFILCFEGDGWYRRTPYMQLLIVALGGMAYSLSGDFENASVKALVPMFACALFICCMVCHGELTRLKPHPKYLTAFYLMISVGGALGGVFVALLAPRIFNAYYELPLSFIACGALALVMARVVPTPETDRNPPSGAPLTARLSAALPPASVQHALAGVLLLVLTGYLAYHTRLNLAGSRLVVRNFYGGLKVKDYGSDDMQDSYRSLTHGTINHGEEFLNPIRRNNPTTYYGPQSGVGLAIRAREAKGAVRVGVIGLGTGTLAAYGRAGDYFRFYEINPLVIDLAQKQFFYVTGTKAQVTMALGDGRLSLEREQPNNFDVLAVDAFSSDSIPVHLLTKEAFTAYFRHLKPGGILAVHVSNKYLNLQPVVKQSGDALGKAALVIDTDDDEDGNEIFGCTWVLLSDTRAALAEPLLAPAHQIAAATNVRLWTDDYSNLFQILR